MTPHHGPPAPVDGVPVGGLPLGDLPLGDLPLGPALLAGALLGAGAAYVAAARAVGARRGPWPAARTARWLLGLAAAAAGLALFTGAHDLRVHVAGHLLLGMAAPLLLVTAAPVTLVLRAAPPCRGRALGRLLRSRPVAVATHPAVAGLLDAGGLWLMYRTDLLAAVPPSLLAAHMLLAGYLLAFSLVGADPTPHRAPLGVRAGVVVAVVAAHDVLAKHLYAHPPDGVPAAQAEAAAQLMYYAALPVHLALFVLLGREWAAGRQRARERSRRRAGAGAPGEPGLTAA